MPRALLPSHLGPVGSCHGENKILPPLQSPIPTPMGPAVLRGAQWALQAEASTAFGSKEALLGAGESLVVYEDADGAGGGPRTGERLPGLGAAPRHRGWPEASPPCCLLAKPASSLPRSMRGTATAHSLLLLESPPPSPCT